MEKRMKFGLALTIPAVQTVGSSNVKQTSILSRAARNYADATWKKLSLQLQCVTRDHCTMVVRGSADPCAGPAASANF